LVTPNLISLNYSEHTGLVIEWVDSREEIDKNQLIKRGIWIYFILLIFEGALRKWVLPGLATPLLIVRDPIALWLLFTASRKGLLPSNIYMNATFFIGVVAFFTALFLGHGNLAVAMFGARIMLIQFPLIFVIGRVFTREDVEKIGTVLIYISIPMVLLIALQFYSPQSAWVNRGIGGDIGGGGFVGGAMGFFRPPGTFSFTNGVTQFFSLDACFVFYFWLVPKKINRIVLIAATIGMIASISLSISRSLLFSIVVSALFALFAMFRNPRLIGRGIVFCALVFLGLLILSQTNFFKTSTEVFGSRYEDASREEGGTKGVLGGRYLGGLTGAVLGSSNVPFFGYGLGIGTNAGANLLTGKKVFLISEGEWGRVIGELGPLLGILFIFIRVSLTIKLGILSFKKLNSGVLLPWMLLSYVALNIPQGQFAQPTHLGFAVFGGGLIIASLNDVVSS
jgi:hypothetical protein